MRRNYALLGESAFHTTGNVTEPMIKEQAKKVGADAVLYSSRYMGAEQGVAPVTTYTPGETYTTQTYGNANASAYGTRGYGYGTANYSGTTTTTTPGSSSTTYVPVTRHRYQHDLTFWRKHGPTTFGVYVKNLPDDLRARLQRNTGVLVTVVMEDSPAFRANILPNDVILTIDGKAIESAQDYMNKKAEFAGKRCAVEILRDGSKMEVAVQMNQEQQGQ